MRPSSAGPRWCRWPSTSRTAWPNSSWAWAAASGSSTSARRSRRRKSSASCGARCRTAAEATLDVRNSDYTSSDVCPQPERIRSSLLLVGLLALAVVLPRSLLVTRAHSECVDDEYHLDHGLAHLMGVPHPLTYNDPPLGEVVLVLPLYLMGARVAVTVAPDSTGRPVTMRNLYHGQRHSPQTLRMVMAAWKSLLFVPCVVVAFAWTRRLYGVRSAWLAAALLLVEPTIAAHIPVAALDVLAMEM